MMKFTTFIVTMFWCSSHASDHGRKIIHTKDVDSGQFVTIEEINSNENDECYQFTYVGVAEDDNMTSFSTCADLEQDVNISNISTNLSLLLACVDNTKIFLLDKYFYHWIDNYFYLFSSSPRRSVARCRVSTRWCGPTTTRTRATRPTSRRSSTSAPAPAATPPACGAAVSGSGVVQRGTKNALSR